MRYFKSVNNNYIIGVGTGNICMEISEAEYHHITEIFHSKPIAPDGYDYRLKADLSWELYELPPRPIDDDLTAEEALAIITGGASDD